MIKSVPATKLTAGMKMALPFNRTATITEVRVGHKFVNFATAEYGKSRVGKHEEVLVEGDDNGQG